LVPVPYFRAHLNTGQSYTLHLGLPCNGFFSGFFFRFFCGPCIFNFYLNATCPAHLNLLDFVTVIFNSRDLKVP
jgi:hypothetical protein